FTEALNKAKEAAKDDTASEETVAQALQALNDAKAALKSADDVKPEDFNNVGAAGSTVDQNALILDAAGDHFAMLSTQKTPSNDFHFEADVQLLAGTGEGAEGDQMSAALVFGAANKKQPGTKWYGANVDTRRKNEADYFRVFGAGRDILSGGRVDDVDATKPLHLAVDVKADGSLTYTFGNVGANMHTATGTIENWEGGYVGLLTFCAKAAFSNVRFTDRTVEQEKKPIETDNRWDNNLGESVAQGGSWSMSDDGLFSDATGKGDTFLISQMEGENFVYETDLSYRGDTGAAGLLFRFSNTENGKEGYAVNVDAGSHKAKFWRWEADQAQQLITEKEVEKADTYHLKVVCIDGSIQYWVNGVLIANLGDFTMQKDDLGQNTIVTKGYYGLLNWNSEAVFQNTKFTVLNENNTPVVLDVDVKSHTGTVDKKAQFFPESPTWMQYVKNDAQTVYLEAQTKEGANVTFEKDGTTYAAGQDIPIAEGANWITMTIEQDGVSRTYRLNVHRFAKESTYYNEPYRGQFHYSVKEGWANDPNGLVKYNGKYHMFYQFYDDTKWGPMHWMHATSTDLLHWEEEPVAFYPDMNGTMFSGCVAVDETNASKLFKTNKGGLIAYITVNGNGQRIKLAYSEDEGKTWKKSDKIAADWSDDSLYNKDFRDPKVFNWEGKWFMVVAGGPLRIYSSDDMVNWKEESAYNDLHTECPDLYPQQVDGTVKWILSRGGRYYKVGDLKEVNGKWTFVPDDYYKDKDGVMNFGRDSYAAMTYYESSFGTAANPTIPDIIELNWMNTWDDYCNQVADTVGQKYNGTFNLHLKIGLVRDANGVYRLTQTPIEAYEQLRGTGVEKSDKVGADNDLLKDFQGTSYEIVSRFIPESGTKKVGFKVRTGANGEETAVIYDVENNTLTLDRSKSGIQISNKFAETNSQDLSDLIQRSKTTRNADGSIDLHLFVDASSVEVFANGYTAAGANQIFPLPTSRGASVVVEGDPCQVDLTVYPLDSIWKKENVGTIIDSSDAREQTIYTGKTKQLSAYILPVDTDQSVEWSSDNPDVASVDENGIVSGHKAGTATITVQAKSDPALKLEFAITVKEDNFNTNVNDAVTDGNWVIENDELINDNKGQNAFWLSKETFDKDYTVSTDVKFGSGLVNIFFASNGSPFDKEAYAVQLTQDNALRLFRFGGGDDATVELDKPLCDDTYHNVEITKKGKSVTVSVDGKEVLKHTYDTVDSHFDTAHVGLGLWDGKASFKNFMVTTAEQPVVVDKTALNEAIEEASKVDPAP
ncbi:GH32 C-terminal domain-containing protein, partial [uncultured Dubosiella sp.]